MENVHKLRKNLPLSHSGALSYPGGLPGKSSLDVNWNSGTGKMLQVVQLEEPYLPEAHSEPACCCKGNSWVSVGLDIQKVEHFRMLTPFVFMALALL